VSLEQGRHGHPTGFLHTAGSFAPKAQTPEIPYAGPATAPKHQIKRRGEGRERRFIRGPGTRRGNRQSEHSDHLQPSLGCRREL
jgi:hypothetical protein